MEDAHLIAINTTEPMPKLTIDNREIEVPEGTRVIDAAERAGIYIPRFCYFAELGAVGACRVCAVKFKDGPVSGIQMSCMVDAADNMVVSTTDAEAVDFRRHVIEWMMMNHPHDCPVCDEGGHCLLQDLTEACGHGIRRYPGKKRTYADQYLGPLICHEENRCIQCYRCSRFYQEYCGYNDLGIMGIAQRIYFGRHKDGVLENPFSGNLIDLCPTGVYTDKPSRYTGRRWDFQRTSGICIHCSLGCSIKTAARYRQIVRLEARHSEAVNGAFICDRGRYGFFYANSDTRPRQARVDGEPVGPGQAAAAAVKRLESLTERHGEQTVAMAGSGRSSLETLAACTHLCRILGWRGPVFQGGCGAVVRAAVCRLSPENAVSMHEIQSADFVLTVGADPVNESPMLTLALRQAWRKGAAITAIDPRALDWPMEFLHISVRPDEIPALLRNLAAETDYENRNSPYPQKIEAIQKQLEKSRRPVVVCGTEITDAETVNAAADLVERLRAWKKDIGLFYTLPMANTYGAVLVNDHPVTPDELIDQIESGQVNAMVVVESDLWETYPDRDRLTRALKRLKLLVAVDCLSTQLLDHAHIVIPSLTVFEAGGTYVNQEARAQWSNPAHAGGIPIKITGNNNHPPRVIRPGIPGGDIPSAWETALRLAGIEPPADSERMADWMVRVFPFLEPIRDPVPRGARIFMPESRRKSEKSIRTKAVRGDFMFISAAAVLGDEPLSSHSPCLESYFRPPELWMAFSEANTYNAAEGSAVCLDVAGQRLHLRLRISENVAPGVLLVYRHPGMQWRPSDSQQRFYVNRQQISISGPCPDNEDKDKAGQ